MTSEAAMRSGAHTGACGADASRGSRGRRGADLARADALERDGDLFGAIEVLTDLNRHERSDVVERRLVDLRHRAMLLVPAHGGPEEWPPPCDDPFPDVDGLPEVDPGELDGRRLRGGICHHGAVVVRGLLDAVEVRRFRTSIDRALAEYGASGATAEGEADPSWFVPFDPPDRNVAMLRKWVADHGGLWLADSPALMFELLEILRRNGVLGAIGAHFGESPALSLEKSTLRCTPPHDRIVSWHQDGAFLDDGVRTVNVWIALTPCGGEAATPGLDLFPRRFDTVLEPDGDIVPHSVGFETIDRLAEETTPVRPAFAAGDALLFDELFLHRTGISPGMVNDRYAIESWFFAASRSPGSYTSFVA